MTTVAVAPTTVDTRYGFRDAVRMEWIKLRTLRSTAWTLLVAVAGSIGLGVGVLAGYRPAHFAQMSPADLARFDPTNMGFSGTAIAMLALPVLGALAITGEYGSGSIASTLAAIPNRRLVLAAKAAVFGAVALAVGEFVTFAIFLGGNAVLTSAAPHASLSQPAVLRTVVLTGAFLALLGLVGLGVGAIAKHTAGAITALVGVVFVAPIILLIVGREAALDSVGRFTPLLLNENSIGAVKPVPHALSAWAGFAVICLYAAVALGVGGWLLRRRDA